MTDFVMRPSSPPVVRSNSFDDLLPEGVTVAEIQADRVTFTAEVDATTATAIADRMISADPEVLAARAALREAATAGATNLAQMLVAYTLGDPMPAAVLPATTTTTSTSPVAAKAATAKKARAT